MTCENHTNYCDNCERRLCDRCARCYERVARAPGPHFIHRCPARYCRWIKFTKRALRGYA